MASYITTSIVGEREDEGDRLWLLVMIFFNEQHPL